MDSPDGELHSFFLAIFPFSMSYREICTNNGHFQPFVDPGHPLHDLFPPRVWAIRIPVILILLGSAIVGSFLSMVMIKSNRKRVAKGKAAAVGKKKA
jgi:dolichyl-phosphate mannosyltransferase polypeptide 2 regulatory subunit